MTTVVYIDNQNNFKNSTSGNYTKFDHEVRTVGILFDKNGDTFLAYPDDNRGSYSQLYYNFDIKIYIETKSGAFSFIRTENYTLSSDKYIWESLDSNFGNFETNIYDNNGIIKDGLVTEQIFCLNVAKGKYTGSFALNIFDLLSNMLIKKYS